MKLLKLTKLFTLSIISLIILQNSSNIFIHSTIHQACCCFFEKDVFRGFTLTNSEIIDIPYEGLTEKITIMNNFLEKCHANRNGFSPYENIKRLKENISKIDPRVCEIECKNLMKDVTELYITKTFEKRHDSLQMLREKKKKYEDELKVKINENIKNLYFGQHTCNSISTKPSRTKLSTLSAKKESRTSKINVVNNTCSNTGGGSNICITRNTNNINNTNNMSRVNNNVNNVNLINIINNSIQTQSNVVNTDDSFQEFEKKDSKESKEDNLSFSSFSSDASVSKIEQKAKKKKTVHKVEEIKPDKKDFADELDELDDFEFMEGSDLKKLINSLELEIIYMSKKNSKPFDFIMNRLTTPDDILFRIIKIFETSLEEMISEQMKNTTESAYFQFKLVEQFKYQDFVKGLSVRKKF